MCECEFAPYEDDDDEVSYHFKRECKSCNRTWWGLHCPHDGVQRPCPHCNVTPTVVPDTDVTPHQG